MEFGFQSESSEKALKDFTLRDGELKLNQEGQFWIVLMRQDGFCHFLSLNVELPDETHVVCLLFTLYFGSETDLREMHLDIWRFRIMIKYQYVLSTSGQNAHFLQISILRPRGVK